LTMEASRLLRKSPRKIIPNIGISAFATPFIRTVWRALI